eukprot:COSAG01_NODE_1861_length_9039_cov_6.964094_8_plen_66_part_00
MATLVQYDRNRAKFAPKKSPKAHDHGRAKISNYAPEVYVQRFALSLVVCLGGGAISFTPCVHRYW